MDIAGTLLLLFIGAFISLWIPTVRIRWILSLGLLTFAYAVAFLASAITLTGLLWSCLLLVLGRYYHYEQHQRYHIIRLVFLLLILGLGFGLLPGFEAVTLYGTQILKSGSGGYTLHIRPDKVLAGFALLAFVVPLTRDIAGWRRIVKISVPLIAITSLLVLTTGWLSNYVAFNPQMPGITFLLSWGFTNLLFVTGIEEGFFRGVIQKVASRRFNFIIAIGISALLFGLAHFAGGIQYIGLAVLAGLGYGTAYHLAGQRVEAAMFTHFGLNLLHLLLFTYPYALSATAS